MAEVKNSFLSSKMNKDLDDRLIPNSEYRDALNIEVGKSEQDSIGTLQNVLGNYQLTKVVGGIKLPLETTVDLECIGMFMDNQNNRIYQFLTNYRDPVPAEINLAPINTVHKITVYDFNTAIYSTLVEGAFLNFSKTNLILGLNLIEGLLFWTDNRNQPRKINYFNAISDPNYYTDEVQISVAKYAPIESPILYRKITTTAAATQTAPYLDITVADATGIVEGMTLISNTISGSDFMIVTGVVGNVVTLYQATPAPHVTNGDTLTFLISTMSNQEDDPNWPGDPAYLENKYVRFSYRFKFDDNEYSLLSPFSQIAFIPNQKGYFINGDEQAAYRSTIIKWMINNTNNIEILITLPDIGKNIVNSYKIQSIEILYKESNSNTPKVLDSVPVSDLYALDTNIYTYTYQSQKPYKTLTEEQIVRVYDKVPTRALTQEIASNRIIYGNIYTNYNAPSSINYNVSIQPKSDIFSNFIEYPNHTLKQNRNYQVGFILSDKFGRQSSVILSTVDLEKTAGFSGSTVYAPYIAENNLLFPGVKKWFGNALTLLVNDTIKSTRSIPNGTPGLYATISGAIPGNTAAGFQITSGIISGANDNIYTYTLAALPAERNFPIDGTYLRGKYTDYVKVLPGSSEGNLVTDGAINDIYNWTGTNTPPDIKYSYSLNQIGWYSYKVVVKQKEQDYYNVYLPGMLNGYPYKQTSGSQVIYTDPTTSYTTQIPNVSWSSGSTVITLPGGLYTTSLLKIGDSISGILPSPTAAIVTQIINATTFAIDQTPPTSGVNLPITVFGAPSSQTSSLQNGINITNFPVNETNKTAHIVLINDNINKVPRDLNEVGPDQTQYRSSVELYGRVENYSTKTPLVGENIITNYTADTIKFSISSQVANFMRIIKVGDGIQSVQAAVPVNNPTPPGGQSLPYPWFKNTVISSIEIDPTDITGNTGIIKFTPPNVLLDSNAIGGEWKDFIITKAENIQYYPVRKADLVNTIAYAADLNFLQNTVDNIQGTAGLNFYQLENNPLVGRVSTSKSIGEIADNMLPTLSVYETRPVESLLDIFWETASTGYISDLNFDVNTGFDGASQLSDVGFNFRESQNPLGSDDDPDHTGYDDSPYITDDFYVLNNTNIPLVLDSIQLVSVYNNATPIPINFVSKFALVAGSLFNTYRVKILNDFLFNFNAPTESSFTFKISATYSGITSQLEFTGRLKNAAPRFLLPDSQYDRVISANATNIVTLTATNGAHKSIPAQVDDQDGLYFSILSGNNMNYFSLTPATGVLSLIDPNIPLGVYPISVKVQDAMSFATNPPSPLINIDPDYSTLEDTVTFTITVGPETISTNLEYWDNQGDYFEDGTFFAVYVGDRTTNLVSELPTPPGLIAGGGWSQIVNPAWQNITQGIYPIPPSLPDPTGLTKGDLRFKLQTQVDGAPEGYAQADTRLLIYYRQSSQAPNNTWQLVKDSNEAGTTVADWNTAIKIYCNSEGASPAATTGIIRVSTPGEYCFAIKKVNNASYGALGIYAVVEDANYYYNKIYPTPTVGLPLYDNPFIPKERYLIGLSEFLTDYPNGIPYLTQDPSTGFNFISTGIVSVGTQPSANSVTITPTSESINGLLAEGLWLNASTQITNVNPAGSLITLSSNNTIPNGTTLTFKESFQTDILAWKPHQNIYVQSKDATFVNQFFTTSDFQTLWTPPIANRFYNFQNSTLPVTANTLPTNAYFMAFNSAKVSSTGAVVALPGFSTILGYNRNFESISPAYYTVPFITYRLSGSYDVFGGNPRIRNISNITTTEATVWFLADNPLEQYWLTWASDCTTPTKDVYPLTSYSITYDYLIQSYTITGLLPNTTYYVLFYTEENSQDGYINGSYFPYEFTTLPV